MSASGLFDDIRMRQIQGVAYVHRWKHASSGAIHLYVHGAGQEAAVIPANSSSAVIVDGSVCQHGVDMHRHDARRERRRGRCCADIALNSSKPS